MNKTVPTLHTSVHTHTCTQYPSISAAKHIDLPLLPLHWEFSSTIESVVRATKRADGEQDEGVRRVELWTLGTNLRRIRTRSSFSLAVFFISTLSTHPQTTRGFQSGSSPLGSSLLLALSSFTHAVSIRLILISSDFCFPLFFYTQTSFFLRCFYWTFSIKT